MVKPAASLDTPKCFDIEGKQPLGDEDANVAFMTSITAAMVMKTRRPLDQLCGFSTSPGAKPTLPSSSRKGVSSRGSLLVRYGLATGFERTRLMYDMVT